MARIACFWAAVVHVIAFPWYSWNHTQDLCRPMGIWSVDHIAMPVGGISLVVLVAAAILLQFGRGVNQ